MRPDIHSFAHPDEAVIKHLSLNLEVDFSKKILSGKVTLDIENKTGTDTLHLDSRDLNITKVSLTPALPSADGEGEEKKLPFQKGFL